MAKSIGLKAVRLTGPPLTGHYLRLRNRLHDVRWFCALCAFSSPLLVYGRSRTADAVPPVAAGSVATSLILFVRRLYGITGCILLLRRPNLALGAG
jgi:hypothetical protein